MTIYSQVGSLIKVGVSILGVKYLFKVQIIHFWYCAGNFRLNTKISLTPAFFYFLFFFKSKVIDHKIELDQSFCQQSFS